MYLHPQIPDFLAVSLPNIGVSLQTIHQLNAYLLIFDDVYISIKKRIDPYG